MPRTIANGVGLHWERMGDPDAPAVLLIMGFSMQLTAWPEDFCRRFVAAGFQVVRFDNRDIGLSDRLGELGRPKIPSLLARRLVGLTVPAPYPLSAMADDAASLLDALGIERAHVVGASMGGMIAQRLAIDHPARLRSLTSIMSTTGELRHGWPRPSVTRLVLAPPPAPTLEARIEYGLKFWRAVGSPGDRATDAELRADIASWFERSSDLTGRDRQLAAILAERSRVPALRRVTIPSLVLHGEADPLVPLSGGRSTARALPNSRLVTYPGMGHDLRPRYLEQMAREIIELAGHADRSG